TQGPLPDNDQALAAIARVGLEEWVLHKDTVRAFFKSKDGKLHHKRCDRELDAQRMLSASRQLQAKLAATARWTKTKLKQQDQSSEHAGSNAEAVLRDATRQDTTNISYTPANGVLPPAAGKKPSTLSRVELEAHFAKKRGAGGHA